MIRPRRTRVPRADNFPTRIARSSANMRSSRTEQRTTGSSTGRGARAGVGGDRFLPRDGLSGIPSLRDYRYIERDNRTYVIEPRERTIIEQIDWQYRKGGPPRAASLLVPLSGRLVLAGSQRPERNQGNFKNRRFCSEPDIDQDIRLNAVLFGLLVPDRCSSNAAAQHSFS